MRVRYFSLLLIVVLSACINRFSYKDSIRKGDIVVGPPGHFNIDKIETFTSDIKAQKASNLRIVLLTDEGDPVIEELRYENSNIYFTFDNSRDKFGGRDKGKRETVCKDMNKAEKNGRTIYYIEGCSQSIGIHDSAENKDIVLSLF